MAITRSRSARTGLLEPVTKKSRLQAVPDNLGKSNHSPPIWLDRLPPEVCERIATAVTEDEYSTDALSLARTSAVQCRAVIAALSHTLMLHDVKSLHQMSWMAVFVQGVRKVVIKDRYPWHPETLRNASLLLSASTLRSADIPDDPVLLSAVARTSSLEELTVSLCEDGPWPIDATRLLMQTLRPLRVRKLELRCRVSAKSTCPLMRIEGLGDSPHALANCCPDLLAFHVVKCNHGVIHCRDVFWAIWSTLPHIHEVALCANPPDRVMSLLRKIPCVKIANVGGGCLLARRLGAAVTHLICYSPVVKAMEVAGLSECKNMTDLELDLEEGAECALQEAVPAMLVLDSLRVRWHWKGLDKVRHSQDSTLSGRDMAWIDMPRYVDVSSGVLLRAVQQLPSLTHIDMLQGRIAVGEIVGIIRHVGGGLRHLGISFRNQEESSVERLRVVLETIMEHSRGLRTVCAGGEGFHDMAIVEDCMFFSEGQWGLFRKRGGGFRGLLRRVRECVPLLDPECLRRWIVAVNWTEVSPAG